MAIYSVANLTTGTASAAASLEVIGGSNLGYRLLELGFTINAATASIVGYGTPAATGVVPTTPVTVLTEDAGNTATGNTTTALAWSTGPTVPAAFYRRVGLPNTIGAGIIWTFPRGINVLKSKSTILWNLQINSALNTWVVVDE